MPRSSRRGRRRARQPSDIESGGKSSPPPPYTEETAGPTAPPPPYCNHNANEETPLLIGRPRPTNITIRNRQTLFRFPPGIIRFEWNQLGGRADLAYFCRIAAFSLLSVFIFAALVGVLIVLFSLLLSWSIPPSPIHPEVVKVAIIGAGPAGVSAACWLRHSSLAKQQQVQFDVTLFESAPLIGGQLALNGSDGDLVYPYDDYLQHLITAEDITGTALLWNNALFTKDSEKILGDKIEICELDSQQVAYYSGEDFVTEATVPYDKTPISSWLGQIWRYGTSVWHAGAMAKEGNLRDRILKVPLTANIEEILRSLKVRESAQRWAATELEHRGIVEPYVTDVLNPQVRRAYGQHITKMSGLALAMTVAQGDSSSLFRGGDLVERLGRVVRVSGVKVRTSTQVMDLKYTKVGSQKPAWLVRHTDGQGPWSELSISQFTDTDAFDHVVMTACDTWPLYVSIADLENDKANTNDSVELTLISDSMSALRPVQITFFTTRSTPTSDGKALFDLINGAQQNIFVQSKDPDESDSAGDDAGIHEIAFVRDIGRTLPGDGSVVEHLFRVLSDDDVTDRMREHFNITWMYQKRLYHAYPYLYPEARYPPFKRSNKGLWSTSVIKTVGNTVDLSWLAGKIVAEDLTKDVVKRD